MISKSEQTNFFFIFKRSSLLSKSHSMLVYKIYVYAVVVVPAIVVVDVVAAPDTVVVVADPPEPPGGPLAGQLRGLEKFGSRTWY